MSEPTPFPGTDRFQVRGRLGQGAMGVVYRVYDCELGREVALKALHRPGPEAMRRLKSEFRARAGITHENLLQLHELFVVNDLCFFTMDLVEGKDFLSWIRLDLAITSRSVAASGDGHHAAADPLAGTTLGIMTAIAAPAERAGAAADPAVPVVRHAPVQDEAWRRLRSGFAQLVQGLHALHEAGRVHRDVKPANILVTEGDRVLLLDFGLVMEIQSPDDGPCRPQDAAGTPAYMAPEQIDGLALTRAADFYAVGAALYEAITGLLPFRGDVSTILYSKRHAKPHAVRDVAPGAPDDLADLAMDLLARLPEQRPGAEECLARLRQGATSTERLPPPEPRGPPFVGRQAEIDALDAALAEVVEARRQITVHVHGPSGIGKSTLIRAFLDMQRRARDPLVLRARCHPHESVPYKALDAAIDDIAHHLEALRPGDVAALVPAKAYALLQLFPVLAKFPAFWSVPAPPVLPDALELRQQGFGALRELFGRLSERRPLVVWLDDVQWGDIDSAPLLDELLRPPAPPFLLLLGYRSEERERSPLLRHLLGCDPSGAAPPLTRRAGSLPPVRDIELGALEPPDIAALTRALLDAARPEAQPASSQTDRHVSAVIAQSEGNPFIASEMARHLAARARRDAGESGGARMDVAQLVLERIHALEPELQGLLEVAAVAGKPLDRDVALEAAGLDQGMRPAIGRLCDAHLLRQVSSGGAGAVAVYHDRIREALAGAMPAGVTARRHRGIAESLVKRGSSDDEALLLHWEGAGELRLAGRHALRAADRASAALAFDHAAALYEKSLGLLGDAIDPSGVLEKLGDALANRGRAPEAARRYLEAAETPAPGGPARAGALRRRAAEQFIKGGFVDEGWREMRRVLESLAVPIPGSFVGAIGAAQWRRGLFLARRFDARRAALPATTPADERPLLDALWTASTSTVMMSPHLADAFRMLHLLRVLNVGDASAVCRALAYEAAMETHIGGPLLDRSVDGLLDQVTHLASRTRDPYDDAWRKLAIANVAFTHGRWRDTAGACRDADATFREHCPGSAWERVTVAIFHHFALVMLGELRKLRERLEDFAEDARLRGDIHALCEAFVGEPMLAWIAADRGDEALQRAAEALGRQASQSPTWPESGYRRQSYAHMIASNYVAHSEGDAWPAWSRVLEHWPELRASFLLPLRCTGLELRWARARAALAAAAAAQPPARTRWTRQDLLGDARRQIRWIERDPLAFGKPVGALLRAGIARIEGREDVAARALERAVDGFAGLDMALHREAARYALAEITGGSSANAMRQRALEWMAWQGVARPEAVVTAVATGVVAPR